MLNGTMKDEMDMENFVKMLEGYSRLCGVGISGWPERIEEEKENQSIQIRLLQYRHLQEWFN